MNPNMEAKLHKISDAAKAAGEAVSSAGDACLAIAVGQIAGVGATCLDKLFPNGDATAHDGKPQELSKETEQKNEPKKAPTINGNETSSDCEIDKSPEVELETDHEALNRKKAEELAEALSKSVSAPADPLVPQTE